MFRNRKQPQHRLSAVDARTNAETQHEQARRAQYTSQMSPALRQALSPTGDDGSTEEVFVPTSQIVDFRTRNRARIVSSTPVASGYSVIVRTLRAV